MVSDVGLYELIAISDDSPELPTIGKCRADLCEQLDSNFLVANHGKNDTLVIQ